MNYLRQLTQYFSSIFKRPKLFNSNLESAEPVARFLLSVNRRYFDTVNKVVKPEAFKPSNKFQSLSVYRTKDCDKNEIWSLGDKFVSALMKDKPEVLAYAEVSIDDLYKHSLKLNPDGKPHERHLNIEGWPLAADEKSKLKMITVELASAAKLIVR